MPQGLCHEMAKSSLTKKTLKSTLLATRNEFLKTKYPVDIIDGEGANFRPAIPRFVKPT